MTTRFSSKDPGERVLVRFNYPALGLGVPSAPDVQVAVHKGTDPAANAIRDGAAFVSDGWVCQWVIGGLDGVDYALKCFATVGGQLLLIDGILPVRASPRPA